MTLGHGIAMAHGGVIAEAALKMSGVAADARGRFDAGDDPRGFGDKAQLTMLKGSAHGQIPVADWDKALADLRTAAVSFTPAGATMVIAMQR